MKIKNRKNFQNPIGVWKYTGLILISPFIIGFIAFTLYPFVSSFIIGLTEYDNVHQPKFIGADNYINMFKDREFLKAAAVTLKYAAILVPIKLVIALLTAMLLNLEIKGIGVFRTIFYIPSILGANLSIVIMWQYLFTSNGLMNQFLKFIGIAPISWYGEAGAALSIIVLLRVWEFGSTMIIFLTALHGIPRDYYDAAKTDGCGSVRTFFKITLPLLKNVIFINLVLQTISALQEFSAPYMITGGSPMKSTYTVGMMIYDEMFSYNNIGYANAVSWVLFIVIAVIVFLLYKLSGRMREVMK